MYTAYYDESGTHDGSVACVVAGFVAPDEQWVEFERNWSDTLNQFGITLFHMRDFNHSLREFSKFKQNQPDRQWFLRQLLSHINLRVTYSVGHAVMMRDYREVNTTYALDNLFSPYALAGRTCVARINLWAEKRKVPKQEVRHVFEDGAAGRNLLYKSVLRDHNMRIVFKKKDECVPLQAADLFASEMLAGNRRIFEDGVAEWEKLRFPIRELSRLMREPLDWGTYEKEDLERFCEKASIPRRTPNAVGIAG